RRCIQGRRRKGRPAQYRGGGAINIGGSRILRAARHSSGVRTNACAFRGLYDDAGFAVPSRTYANRASQACASLYAINNVVCRKNLAEAAERQTRQAASHLRILKISGSLCETELTGISTGSASENCGISRRGPE